ncbi:MAG: YeiH family protein [Fimbriimonadaceae bacterium]
MAAHLVPYAAPAALVFGAAAALIAGNPFAAHTKKLSRALLQASVVLLGFSMDLRAVLHAGASGLVYGIASISAVFALGFVLQRVLKVRPVTGLLVSTGTAICGGSAIAAVSTVIEAPAEDVSVAVGAVFLLNALALLVFPPIGHALALTQNQFGVWAGIAIHDIASVAGAGVAYGQQALDTATAVKLSRVLYLVPLTLIIAWAYRRPHAEDSDGKRRSIAMPWFVGLFLVASAVRSYVPVVDAHSAEIKLVAACGFALSLYVIGLGLSRATLRAVGVRPLVMGAVLWICISIGTLVFVRLT